MDQIEQETSRDDPAVEVTDLPSTEGKSNGPAPHAGILSGRQVIRSPSIWRNWPLVTAAGILLLLIIMALPILPSIFNQLSRQNPSTSAAIHATPTPILSPLSGGHSVYPTLAHGIIYIGASDGAITAVRASNGSRLWQYRTSGAAYAPLVINGVVYASDYVGNNGPAHLYALRASDGKLLWSYTRKDFINLWKPGSELRGCLAGQQWRPALAVQRPPGNLGHAWQHRLCLPG